MTESYPPRIEDLQAAFLSTHRDYRFELVGTDKLPCPIEKIPHPALCPACQPRPYSSQHCVGCSRLVGNLYVDGSCNENGARHTEWCVYIGSRGRELAKEAGIPIPPSQGQMSIDPFRHLWLTIQWYRELCRNPALTPAARLAREQKRADANRQEKEQQERKEQQRIAAKAWAAKQEETQKEDAQRFQQDLAAIQREAATAEAMPSYNSYTEEDRKLVAEHRQYIADCKRRDTMMVRHGITSSDAEAVLFHLAQTHNANRFTSLAQTYSCCSFKKDTLTALRTINEFARKHGIRVEDAVTVLTEA